MSEDWIELSSPRRVHEESGYPQRDSTVTALADGGFAVVWQTRIGPDVEFWHGRTEIALRFFNADGTPRTNEVFVSDSPYLSDDMASVAALADGTLAVIWANYASSPRSVSIQRIAADGTRLGDVIPWGDVSDEPEITALPDGGFAAVRTAVTWIDSQTFRTHVLVQQFNAQGVSVGGQVLVTPADHDTPIYRPHVTALQGGGLLVAWDTTDPDLDGSGTGTFARLIDANGIALGEAFALPSETEGNQWDARVSALTGGGFVAIWSQWSAVENYWAETRARVFDATGTALGDDFLVNQTNFMNQSDGAVTALRDGGFAVVWTNEHDIWMRLFNADASAQGGEVKVLDTSDPAFAGYEAPRVAPSVAELADGRLVVTAHQLETGGPNDVWQVIVDPNWVERAGTDATDTIWGNRLDNTFAGLAGNDVLIGLGGSDTIFGGLNDDYLDGGDGNDSLFGDSGSDTVLGGAGNDSMDGGSGADSVSGEAGDDTLEGGSAADTVSGGDGNDLIFGGSSADSLSGDGQNDTIYGGTSNDTVRGGAGSDLIYGDDGNDSLLGESGTDTIWGGEGNDTLDGGTASDTLYGEAGADSILGGSSADLIYGGTENDTIRGGTSNDTASGGSGSDLIYGDDGDDSLLGDGGSDVIYGGEGNDTLDGGTALDTLFGDAGADSILGGGSNDLIFGGTENDTIRGGTSNDVAYGGSGNDWIYGDEGNDSLLGDSGFDRLFGGDGNDTLDGGSASDSLYGGAGDDSILGGSSADLVSAGTGNDTVYGGTSNDTIYGGGDNDVIYGEQGSDVLGGGAGQDVFVFNTAIGVDVDIITDFNVADDTIWLENAVFTGLSAGTLGAAAFVSNTSGLATTAAHRVIYESDTGDLYFDADGTGAGARVLFADLVSGLALTHADFLVI